MHPKDTPTDRLIAELEGVCEHVTVGFHQRVWTVTAFVTSDHTGSLVEHVIRPDIAYSFIEAKHRELSVALDDVLGSISLSAPQAVSA